MEAILYIGIAQSLFASLVLLTQRHKKLADKILGTWLVLIGLGLCVALLRLNYYPNYFENYRGGVMLFLFSPILYVYTKSLMHKSFVLTHKDLFHLTPFTFFIIWYALFPKIPDNNPQTDFEMFDWLISRYLFGFTFVAQTFYYGYLRLKEIRFHRNRLQEEFSFTSEKISLSWLSYINILFSLTFYITIVVGLFYYNGYECVKPALIFYSGFALLAFSVSFFGFKQPEIFTNSLDERFEREQVESEGLKHENKYGNSGLKEEDARAYEKKILMHLEVDKPYLNGDLMLNDLSKELDIAKHHITEVLNNRLNKNFYTLINEYRVEEVKHRMKDPANNNLTLLAIGYDSGFNTKSSFYSSFKKITGVTPAQYRKTFEN